MTQLQAKLQLQHRVAELEIENWNLKFGSGVEVSLRRGSLEPITTKTRSEAILTETKEAVIFLVGLPGYYALDHVTPIKEEINATDRTGA